MNLLYGIIVGIFIISSVFYVIARNEWKADTRPELPRFTFKEFQSCYAIKPVKWDLQESYVTYTTSEDWQNPIPLEWATFRDFRKYKKWYKKKEKQSIEGTRARYTEKVVKDIQDDLQKLAEKETK
jgi:hypothetical protein